MDEAPLKGEPGWTIQQRKEAFEVYYAQGIGDTRDIKSVAEILGIPVYILRKWSKTDKWDEKVVLRDRKIDAKLEAMGIEQVADIKVRYQRMLSQLLNEWFKTNVEDPEKLKLLMAVSDIDDILKVMKLSLTLMGEPSVIKKLEGNITHTVEEQLRGLTTDELRVLATQGTPALPPASIDAEIVEDSSADE